ncbi:TPA: hypothetical protein ACPZWY_001482 [Escherichia coli]|uniref:hypothetical protein n=1 Tax=Escherichia coli TaxID=562 RepID=UPI0003914C74|nr:hypothetical protein [Escherichia coli]EFN7148190.1 hypothetical protein [Escherichia coli]EII3447109.1 hypothetical protein [Escherichia coli]EIX0195481.1 hypothetical protein [Escherichia coli]EQO10694.1 hypothetical protein G704_01690 [Escherichia coli HVH 28 (4-0907367)]KAA1946943.1 hypothetical protein EA208_05370 [Escherichia coli]
MKQMTLIEMDGFLKGKCIPRDLKVNETNAEYLVRKFAEAEAKCAALAAEVEAVKSAHQDAVNTIMYTANRTGVLYTEKAIQMSCKTPATDAFLAEVRAQGVEMMREHPSIKLCSLTHICDELAAQLRKGGNQ